MTKHFRIVLLAAGLLISGPLAAQAGVGSAGDQLLAAVKKYDGAAATALLEEPGSTAVNYRGDRGIAALHIVTSDRNTSWLRFLLSKGANPDIADDEGNTPLMLAARSGYSEGVSRLLSARAKVDKENRLGVTPLIAAVQARQPGIVRMLLEAGADPDRADYAAGFSARDYARRDTRSRDLLELIESVQADKASAKMGPSRP